MTKKENLDEKTINELSDFKKKSENQAILLEANQAIERYKRERGC